MTEKLHTAAAWLTANGKNRALRWLVVLGVAGILLIALSEWLPGRSRAQADAASPAAVPVEASAVEAALEKRITAMLDGVQGVGSCRVMVTLEQGVQQVYAAEQSHSSGTQADSSAEKTITVETASGPGGLPVTQLQPTVRGVAVVCDGGDDPAVAERVTRLITAALDIPSRRVCVVK